MSKSLWEIGADMRALEETIIEADGDISDEETEKIIDGWFAEIGAERDLKLDNYAAFIKMLEARAAVRKAEAQRIMALAAPDENLAARLKARLKEFFENHVGDGEKIDTARFKISLVNNGGALPVILDEQIVAHPEEIPEGYRRVVFQADLNAIREALNNGEELDFARLGERGRHIRIK